MIDVTTIDVLALPSLPLSNRFDLPSCPAIYIVVTSVIKRILYVGKARNVNQRWGSHHRLPVLEGADVFIAWIELPADTSDEVMFTLEKSCIQHFKPLLNGTPVDEIDPLVMKMEVTITITDPLVIASISRAVAAEGKTIDYCVNRALEYYVKSRSNREAYRTTLRDSAANLRAIADSLDSIIP